MIAVFYHPCTPLPQSQNEEYVFLLPGSITDSGWNAQMYFAAQQVEEVLDIDIDIVYGLGFTGIQDIYQEVIDQNYQVIWGHSQEYQDVANRLAEDYPEIWFVGSTFTQMNYSNVVNVEVTYHEGAYLCGMLAGGLTNSGKVGFIGGKGFPNVIAQANAFGLGANLTYQARTGASINLSVYWTGVWDDVDLGRSAGLMFLNQSIDVVMSHRSGTTLGVIQVYSSTNDSLVFGDSSDQSALSDHVVASNVANFTVAILNFDQMRQNVMVNMTNYRFGLSTGANQVIFNPLIDDSFLNNHLSNLTSWIDIEHTRILTNKNYIPYLTSPIYT